MPEYFTLEISDKKDNAFGREVSLWDDGTLAISGYDGMTKLNKQEAAQLRDALDLWCLSQ